MSLQLQFNEFEQKIRLTWNDEKLKKIREKDESIRVDIRAAFKEKGYPVTEIFQLGSYAVKTTIEPLDEDHDIDVAVVIDNETAAEDPIEAKKALRDVLIKRNFLNWPTYLLAVNSEFIKQPIIK